MFPACCFRQALLMGYSVRLNTGNKTEFKSL